MGYGNLSDVIFFKAQMENLSASLVFSYFRVMHLLTMQFNIS